MTPKQRSRIERIIRSRYCSLQIEQVFLDAMACDRDNSFDWLTDDGLKGLYKGLIDKFQTPLNGDGKRMSEAAKGRADPTKWRVGA